jgi:hypothetical protein
MSSSLAANSGSLERLKVRMRCGWRSWACPRLAPRGDLRWSPRSVARCTERNEIPAVLAMARPVQWVASPSGSAQVSVTTRCTV